MCYEGEDSQKKKKKKKKKTNEFLAPSSLPP